MDQLKNQKIEGNTELVGSGLFYKSIIHSGNTNVAMEEIDYIEIQKMIAQEDLYIAQQKMSGMAEVNIK